MFLLRADQTTIVLPSPDWGNSSALAATVQINRAMDGESYVYKKNKQHKRKFQWTFALSRHKSIELRSFIKLYHASIMRAIDAEDNSYILYLISNPFEANTGARAGSFPGDEIQRVTLEFEEVV